HPIYTDDNSATTLLCVFCISTRCAMIFFLLLLAKLQVKIGPSEKPISNFFTKKAAGPVKSEKASGEFAETQAFKTAKEESDDDSGENPSNKTEKIHQTSTVVKDEPVTLDPQVFYKADEGIKKEDGMLPDDPVEERDPFSIKRKI
uniref:Uncharacterized protein n=1 Tax=Aegilops tauschii subsp. strangulata TaxID=200361 RepID=A0A453NFM3_AEGTS